MGTNFSAGTILLDLCNSIASNNLRKKSFFSHSSVFGVVRAPLFCINSSFSDDPIGFSFVFRNLKCSPKIGFFFAILSYSTGFAERSFLPPFKMLSFLDYLFVCFFKAFLHRIRSYVAVVNE